MSTIVEKFHSHISWKNVPRNWCISGSERCSIIPLSLSWCLSDVKRDLNWEGAKIPITLLALASFEMSTVKLLLNAISARDQAFYFVDKMFDIFFLNPKNLKIHKKVFSLCMFSPKGIKFQLHRQHLKHFLKHEKRMFSKRLVFCVFNSTTVWVPDNRLRLAANKEKLSTSRLFGKLAEINQQMNWKERRRISPFEKQLFRHFKNTIWRYIHT